MLKIVDVIEVKKHKFLMFWTTSMSAAYDFYDLYQKADDNTDYFKYAYHSDVKLNINNEYFLSKISQEDIRNFSVDKCQLDTKPEKINVDLYRQVLERTEDGETLSDLKYYSYSDSVHINILYQYNDEGILYQYLYKTSGDSAGWVCHGWSDGGNSIEISEGYWDQAEVIPKFFIQGSYNPQVALKTLQNLNDNPCPNEAPDIINEYEYLDYQGNPDSFNRCILKNYTILSRENRDVLRSYNSFFEVDAQENSDENGYYYVFIVQDDNSSSSSFTSTGSGEGGGGGGGGNSSSSNGNSDSSSSDSSNPSSSNSSNSSDSSISSNSSNSSQMPIGSFLTPWCNESCVLLNPNFTTDINSVNNVQLELLYFPFHGQISSLTRKLAIISSIKQPISNDITYFYQPSLDRVCVQKIRVYPLLKSNDQRKKQNISLYSTNLCGQVGLLFKNATTEDDLAYDDLITIQGDSFEIKQHFQYINKNKDIYWTGSDMNILLKSYYLDSELQNKPSSTIQKYPNSVLKLQFDSQIQHTTTKFNFQGNDVFLCYSPIAISQIKPVLQLSYQDIKYSMYKYENSTILSTCRYQNYCSDKITVFYLVYKAYDYLNNLIGYVTVPKVKQGNKGGNYYYKYFHNNSLFYQKPTNQMFDTFDVYFYDFIKNSMRNKIETYQFQQLPLYQDYNANYENVENNESRVDYHKYNNEETIWTQNNHKYVQASTQAEKQELAISNIGKCQLFGKMFFVYNSEKYVCYYNNIDTIPINNDKYYVYLVSYLRGFIKGECQCYYNSSSSSSSSQESTYGVDLNFQLQISEYYESSSSSSSSESSSSDSSSSESSSSQSSDSCSSSSQSSSSESLSSESFSSDSSGDQSSSSDSYSSQSSSSEPSYPSDDSDNSSDSNTSDNSDSSDSSNSSSSISDNDKLPEFIQYRMLIDYQQDEWSEWEKLTLSDGYYVNSYGDTIIEPIIGGWWCPWNVANTELFGGYRYGYRQVDSQDGTEFHTCIDIENDYGKNLVEVRPYQSSDQEKTS